VCRRLSSGLALVRYSYTITYRTDSGRELVEIALVIHRARVVASGRLSSPDRIALVVARHRPPRFLRCSSDAVLIEIRMAAHILVATGIFSVRRVSPVPPAPSGWIMPFAPKSVGRCRRPAHDIILEAKDFERRIAGERRDAAAADETSRRGGELAIHSGEESLDAGRHWRNFIGVARTASAVPATDEIR
jgi:hypothetical protein